MINKFTRDKTAADEFMPAERSPAEYMPSESLLQIVWRRYWVVLLAVVVSLAAALGYLVKATPIYESTSRLYVEQSGPRIITEQEGLMTQSKNYLYTQCGLLQSTPIIAGVTEKPEVLRMKTFANMDNPIRYIKSKINATVGKKDDLISVSFESPYPAEAAQIVNLLIDSYITYHATQKRSTATEVLKILQKEKDKRDQELTDKYQQMLEFKQENSALALEDERGNIMLQGLARLQDALTETQIGTINSKAIYEVAQLMADNPVELRQFIESQRGGYYIGMDRQEDQLNREIQHLQLQMLTLRRKVSSEHPAVQALEDKIEQIFQQLIVQERKTAEIYLKAAHQQWIAAQQREQELQTAFDEQRDQAQDLNTKATQYAILQSKLQRTENLCDILDNRIKELNVTEDVGALNISILEVARPEEDPSRPDKSRIMAMALVLGLMLGVGLALVLDWKDQRLRSADEITAILGIPVLGTVPTMHGKESIVERGQQVRQDPTSPVAEAYKTIRTAVYFGVPDGEARTLLVTSPAPGDGKTTLTSNLAIAMAQAGQRTLIIDADFRKPMQHKVFEMDQEPGLSNVLVGRAQLAEVIRPTGVEHLSVMPCGPIPPNPSELLNSRAFADLIAKLTDQYDRVLFDSPPVMPVTDARILGALCDVTLLVLRAEKSTRKAGEQARDSLLSVGSNLLGVVVNDVNPHKSRYGYYSGYGYYGYGYGHRHHKGSASRSAGETEPRVAAPLEVQDHS